MAGAVGNAMEAAGTDQKDTSCCPFNSHHMPEMTGLELNHQCEKDLARG